MKHLTKEQATEYLDRAYIHSTTDVGHANIHIGRNGEEVLFVMLVDTQGLTVVAEEEVL